MNYYTNEKVRIAVTYTDVDGVPTDPSVLSLIVKKTTGGTDTYTYPAHIVKDAVGVYHYDYTCHGAASGAVYKWNATIGGDSKVAFGQFTVIAPRF